MYHERIECLCCRVKPSANGRQKTLNKCETHSEIVFLIRLRHPETINSVSLNSVSRIRETDVHPILHLEVSCFEVAHTVNKAGVPRIADVRCK